MMIGKKIDTAKPYACIECGNSDDAKLMIIRDAPWVVECMECGHPNDVRWDHDLDDELMILCCAT